MAGILEHRPMVLLAPTSHLAGELIRELARGWVCWHTQWEEQRRKMESMRRSLSHMLNRKLSAGWNAWVEMAEEKALFMQKLRKGLSRMVNRQLAKAVDRFFIVPIGPLGRLLMVSPLLF